MNDVLPSSRSAAAAAAPPSRALAAVSFLLITGLYFFSYFQRVAVPGTLFDELHREFDLSAGGVAWLGAIFLYVYGPMQFVSGVVNDRFGHMRVLLVGGCFLSLGSLAFALAPSVPVLYAARAAVGFGASLLYLGVLKAVDHLFSPERFPTFLCLALFLGYSGGLTGTFPTQRAVEAFGWRPVLLTAGLASCLMCFGVAGLFVATGRPRTSAVRFSPAAFARILGNRTSWPVLVSGSLNFALYFLIQATIGKKFLTDYCGLSGGRAAGFTFVMMLVAMLNLLAFSTASRLMSNRRRPLLLAGTTLTLAAYVLILLNLRSGQSPGWFLVGYVLLAMASGSSPMFSTAMKELNPAELVGTGQGILNGLCYILVAATSNLAGVVLNRYEAHAERTAAAIIYPPEAYQCLFGVCLGLAVLSFVVSLRIRESYGPAASASGRRNGA